MGRFEKYSIEYAIIGRLLMRYSDLELALFNCVQVASGDHHGVFVAMFGKRGEKARIDNGAKLGRISYQHIDLRSHFDRAINAMRWCLTIRNQYAHHIYWDDYSGKLAIAALEVLAEMTPMVNDLQDIQVCHVDVPLLKQQEKSFVYTENLLNWLNFECQFKNGNIQSNLLRNPLKVDMPPLYLTRNVA